MYQTFFKFPLLRTGVLVSACSVCIAMFAVLAIYWKKLVNTVCLYLHFNFHRTKILLSAISECPLNPHGMFTEIRISGIVQWPFSEHSVPLNAVEFQFHIRDQTIQVFFLKFTEGGGINSTLEFHVFLVLNVCWCLYNFFIIKAIFMDYFFVCTMLVWMF